MAYEVRTVNGGMLISSGYTTVGDATTAANARSLLEPFRQFAVVAEGGSRGALPLLNAQELAALSSAVRRQTVLLPSN